LIAERLRPDARPYRDRPSKLSELPWLLDHAGHAADHMLALVVEADPTFQVTAERHGAAVALVEAIVAALSPRRGDR
jgi:hypothetical protein